jgi:hypothetical protein
MLMQIRLVARTSLRESWLACHTFVAFSFVIMRVMRVTI